MKEKPSFDQAVNAIKTVHPDYAHPHPNMEVLIVGYIGCPFSNKAEAALLKHESAKGRSAMFTFERGEQEDDVRKALGEYEGSFPLVYIKGNYIGGGTEYEAFVNKS
jgi:hypothetical protein